ncbi:class I SAM-dependent methyltransferase [Nocardia sp. NPDC057455]|uniref:class I SAM-dependent methyltransferase n=1 Tax=Nocardia sp. NPDC057455 TaxID=3346138 RepID=UPI003671FE37
MLARRALPDSYRKWNLQWGAPFGFGSERLRFDRVVSRADALSAGCFAAQRNSTTRSVEYPWAFHARLVQPGLNVVEVGGALSGFQFVLARCGASVLNVDPFLPFGAPETPIADPVAAHRQMNQWFGTQVGLHVGTLRDARIAADSVDLVYCLSTIEHLTLDEIVAVLTEVRRILRPGGAFVVSVDLFLNLEPFTLRCRNEWGTNVSVRWLVEQSGLTLCHGVPAELVGFEDFDAQAVLSNLERYAINNSYPQLAQMFVLNRI